MSIRVKLKSPAGRRIGIWIDGPGAIRIVARRSAWQAIGYSNLAPGNWVELTLEPFAAAQAVRQLEAEILAQDMLTEIELTAGQCDERALRRRGWSKGHMRRLGQAARDLAIPRIPKRFREEALGQGA